LASGVDPLLSLGHPEPVMVADKVGVIGFIAGARELFGAGHSAFPARVRGRVQVGKHSEHPVVKEGEDTQAP
jgi:hypothetical protein